MKDLDKRSATLDGRELEAKGKENMVSARESNISLRERALTDRDKQLAAAGTDLKSREDDLASREARLSEAQKDLDRRSANLTGRELEAKAKEDMVSARESNIALRERSLADRDKQTSASGVATANLSSKPPRKILGLSVVPLDQASRSKFNIFNVVQTGVVITEVEPNSEAAERRVKAGETIKSINGQSVSSVDDLSDWVNIIKQNGQKTATILLLSNVGYSNFVTLTVDAK
jgi:hypothetical protein